MKTVIDCLAFVMTMWMLYCFVRHGIYPAIRLVFCMIGAIARFVSKSLRRKDCDVASMPGCDAQALIGAGGSRSTSVES